MNERPGSTLAARPLHFFVVADCSGSMAADGKMQALNNAIRETLPHLVDVAGQNPHADLVVRSIAFSSGARWHVEQPTPVERLDWQNLSTGGYTDLGAALDLLAPQLVPPAMEERALAPAILLISDGMPTDDYKPALARFLDEPMGRRAVRMAVGIGRDADLEVLERFIGAEQSVLTANNPEQLVRMIRWASTHASRLASNLAPVEPRGRAPAVRRHLDAVGAGLVTTTAGQWAAATASVRGASHERDGRPNQDAVRVVPVRRPVPGLVAAVCDGHGGGRYVRSDVGSRLGVEVACELGRRAIEALGAAPARSAIEAHLAGPLAGSIVDRWRARVLEDVARRPFNDEERARAGAPLDDDPLVSYGCTMVLALLTPSWIGLLQIGDGDVTVVDGSSASSPVPGDERLVGGETTSLCLPGAAADARVSVLLEPLPETLIVTSDGYANSFASPTWRTDAGLDLRDHARRIGLDALESRLPSWLADSATAGGDDVSMALLHRVDSNAPVVRADAEPLGVTEPARGAAARHRRRGGLIALGLVVAAGAGTGIGWGLAGAGGAADPSATSLPAASIAPPSSTTTTTTTPMVTTTLPPSPAPTEPATFEIGPQDEIVTLYGDGEGIVLAFDAGVPEPTSVRVLARLTVQSRPPTPPGGWSFEPGTLTFGACRYPAEMVAYQGAYIVALGPHDADLVPEGHGPRGRSRDHQRRRRRRRRHEHRRDRRVVRARPAQRRTRGLTHHGHAPNQMGWRRGHVRTGDDRADRPRSRR